MKNPKTEVLQILIKVLRIPQKLQILQLTVLFFADFETVLQILQIRFCRI